MPLVTFFLAVFVAALGLVVLGSNPPAYRNQAFAFCALIGAGTLYSISRAMVFTSHPAAEEWPELRWWARSVAVFASMMPSSLWLLRNSVLRRSLLTADLAKIAPWGLVSLGLLFLGLSDSYIFVAPASVIVQRGWAFYLFQVTLVASTLVFTAQTIWLMRLESGIRKLELKFVVVNFCFVAGLATVVLTLGRVLHSRLLVQSVPLIEGMGFFVSAWAITAHRIFDLRQVLLIVSEHAASALAIGLLAVVLWPLVDRNLLDAEEVFWLIAVCVLLGGGINYLLRRWFDVDRRRQISVLREAIVELARTEPQPAHLVARFEELLSRECGCQRVRLICKGDGEADPLEQIVPRHRPAFAQFVELGWATPESLRRRRASAGVCDLLDVLLLQSVGLLLRAPCESSAPSLLIAFGPKAGEQPYTYPEIQRLQNVAELMDNILMHARVAEDAALKAKAEHLAMMSRGLAHDLKNLITPVSSFLVHTEGRFSPDGDEAEVHAAAKRSVRIMTDYVREALFFSERLAPKLERVAVGDLLRVVGEATAGHATSRGVQLKTTVPPDLELQADRVLLQRMLANLVNNAVDASHGGQTVELSADIGEAATVRIKVVDHGCGIPPEYLGRIFDAYFTTKEFGEEVRGFGLGLTISQKIAELHHGRILVASEVGRGTTMTVELSARPGRGPTRGVRATLDSTVDGSRMLVKPDGLPRA
jgi:signal transduction histidine kinase